MTVYGNVSAVLQVRKTIKIYTAFLVFHNNRNPNTNGNLLRGLHFAHLGVPSEPCTQSDRASREIRIVQNRARSSSSSSLSRSL